MMPQILTFLDSIGIKVPLIISGFAGGLATIDRKDRISFSGKFISILSGSFSANYLTPVVADWMSLKESSMFGLAFLIGYGGLKFIEIAYQKIVKSTNKESSTDAN
jgi:hypothetical protein